MRVEINLAKLVLSINLTEISGQMDANKRQWAMGTHMGKLVQARAGLLANCERAQQVDASGHSDRGDR